MLPALTQGWAKIPTHCDGNLTVYKMFPLSPFSGALTIVSVGDIYVSIL